MRLRPGGRSRQFLVIHADVQGIDRRVFLGDVAELRAQVAFGLGGMSGLQLADQCPLDFCGTVGACIHLDDAEQRLVGHLGGSRVPGRPIEHRHQRRHSIGADADQFLRGLPLGIGLSVLRAVRRASSAGRLWAQAI